MPPSTIRGAAITALFFLSGFSALIYQIAWQRLLGLFGGADTVAATLVICAFLAGLGLGSLLAVLAADGLSRRRALNWFGLCELAIAAYAALSVPLFYDVLFIGLVELSRSRTLVFAVAFVSLIVPTMLMGLSLPLLSRALVDDIGRAARRIGVLYAINTGGAAAGALVGGLWLIGSFGYQSAILVGAVLNAIVGFGALATRLDRGEDHVEPSPAADRAGGSNAVLHRWCLLVFASGFLAVAIQVCWYRLFGVMMQGNAYGFAVVLGVFLLGDALGLLTGALLVDRVSDPRRTFLLLQGLAGLLAVGGAYVIYQASGVETWRALLVNVDEFVVPPRNVIAVMTLIVALTLIASFVVGFTFPLAQRAVQNDPELIGRRVGLIQLANIAGNSLGGLVTGLALLRVFGSSGAWLAVLGLALCFALHLAIGDRRRGAALAMLAAGVALALAFPGNIGLWSRLHGVTAAQSADIGEDHTGLAVLRRFENGAYRMYIQGHSQSCLPVCTVHAFLGLIGPLVHPEPREVLVVGVAAGGTPYMAGINPQTSLVRAVEIVAPSLGLLRRFAGAGGGLGIDRLLSDPHFHLVVGDGRHDLFVEGLSYDVIEADAILPRTAHSGLLYSREYFERMRRALKPGGIAVQWAPTERTIATFRAVFPHVVYAAPALLGSERPIPYDPAALARRLDEPAIRGHLEAAQVNIDELRSVYVAKPPVVWSASARSPDVNTDLWPRDEYYLNNPMVTRW
ncbi:MAG: MFS transporter [Alphaproteobacteria bacterium]|nr:MFS transporter [Alphaproteobacteria bacterium]